MVRVRDDLKWSRAELHRQLAERGFEMHMTTLRRIESGEQEPRLSEAVAIAGALGVQVEVLSLDLGEYPAVMEVAARAARFRVGVNNLTLALEEWWRAGIELAKAINRARKEGAPESLLIEDASYLAANENYEMVALNWAEVYGRNDELSIRDTMNGDGEG